MNTALLHQKVESLKAYPVFSGKDPELSRFETVIAGLSEWQLFRINPLVFAKENGFDARLCVDIFIHGAKIGIFDFAWNLLCPGCGGVEYSVHSMDQIQSNLFHCTICHIDVSTELDNQIEAAFTINNSIYPLALDPFASFDNYRKYFFSSNYVRSQELQGYSQSHFVKFAVIPAGEARPMVFTPEKDALYRLLSMVAHTQIFLPVRAEAAPGPRHFQIDINAGGFMYNELPLPPEEVTLEVHNRTKKPLATVLFKTDFTLMHAILKEHPNTRLPY
ncbi:MAG: DUF5939 domain-containing protein, partial [Candidatus Omnitrophota bacterium]